MNNPQIQALDDKNYLDADTFFTKNPGIALTYGDFSLATHYSEILPRDTDTTSQLTEKIQLSTPIISADMDTVTESNMAIQMALNGGLGIIHSNLSPEEQSKEVAKVKHHVHGIIRNPITISPDKLIGDILQLKYNFSTFPVLDNSGKLLGLLGGESIKERFQNLRVQEAMIKKEKVHHILESELGEDPINTADIFFTDNRGINKLLVIDKEGNLKGLITESDVSRIKKEANSDIKPSRDDEHRLRVGVTLHMIRDANGELDRNKIIEQVEKLVKKGVDIVAISTAHGNSKGVGDMIKIIRQNFKDLDIIAGNVTSAKGVEFLKEMGANVVKVGQGPGSICSTRVVAGVGIPQMTALYICSKAAKILGGITTIADGGITTSGDMVKALTLGDSVMIGGLLAGSDESPGDKVEINGTLYKVYRGMGSKEAMQKGSAARYGHSLTKDTSVKVAAEGISGLKEGIGPVAQTIREFRAGIQSGMGYHGAKNLQELQKIARYVGVTQAGQTEARPHDVLEIKVK